MASAERALYITMQDPAPLAGKEAPPGGKSPGTASPGQAPTPAGADLPGGASAEPGAAPAPSSDQPKVVPAQAFSEEPAGRPVRINYASYPRLDIGEERMRQFLLRQGDDDDLDARERASHSALRKTGAASAPYDADCATTKARRSKSRHSKEVYDDRRRRKSRRAQGSSSSSSSGDSRRGSSDKRPRRKRSHKSRERNRKPRRRHRSSSSSSSIDNRRGERSPAKGKNKSSEVIVQLIVTSSLSCDLTDETPVDSWQQHGTGRVWGNEPRLLDAPGTVFATPSERSSRQSSTFDVKVDSQRTKLAGSVFRYESHPTTNKGHKD